MSFLVRGPRIAVTAFLVLLGCFWLPAAQGQGTAPESTARPVVSLDRYVTLHLDHVSLRDALKVISETSGVKIGYGAHTVPLDHVVTLVSDHISVREALRAILAGTGVEAVTMSPGMVVLEATKDQVTELAQQGTGTITGYVRDSATGSSIPGATVRIDGTALEVQSGSDGRYRIANLATGEYRVVARHVGYLAKVKSVSVIEGETKTVTFDLNPPATQLNEVVTTALGEQRRYQVGNVIATINVDSIAPTAPVTSITDLIAGRAAGVDIVEGSGLVGGGESIRIRGTSSLLVQGDPIVIVDGMRQDNTAGGTMSPLSGPGVFGSGGVPSPSRLNDLDFDQIATIDVLKGPAASTEYGTDAANGVIVITTKRGTAGAPQWHLSATQGINDVPTSFPNYYYTWGHSTSGAGDNMACPLTPMYGGGLAQYGSPFNVGATFGVCVADSVTKFNPLNHAATSIYGTGLDGKYDVDVSAGSDAFRYYVAGGFSNTSGDVHVPGVFRSQALAIGFPASAFRPNAENQRSARANAIIKLGPTADLQTNITYTSTYQETPLTAGLGFGPSTGPTVDDSAGYYGYNIAAYSPLSMLGQDASQQTDATNAGITLNWRPGSWLLAHGTFGVQHESQQDMADNLPQAQFISTGQYSGATSETNGSTDIYTVDMRATATTAPTRILVAKTSLGIQMVDSRAQSLSATAYSGQTPTNLTLDGAPYGSISVVQNGSRSATLGGYVEEELGLSDRLFVTGALRLDGGSGFGRSYSVQPYEKASVSWMALNANAASIRLRAAFGAAGVQPPNGGSLQEYQSFTVFSNGQQVPAYSLGQAGTPSLEPEHFVEYEGGADLAFLENRLTVEITGYSKTNQNAVENLPVGFDAGYVNYYANIGEVRNTGLEITGTATVVASRPLTWTMTVNASANTNKLLRLAAGLSTAPDGIVAGSDGPQRFAAGYPLYGYWGVPIYYSDANHDGILESNEVTYGATDTYVGPSAPEDETSLATTVSLWRGTVALSTLFDYQTGFKLNNAEYVDAANSGIANAQNALGGPLWQQAQEFFVCHNLCNTFAQYEDGTFLRWRELNATVTLPKLWARAIRVSSLSLTGGVRNLLLWTRYQGDPEVGGLAVGGNAQSLQATSGATVVNNDLRTDYGNVPLTRTWTFRVNVRM